MENKKVHDMMWGRVEEGKEVCLAHWLNIVVLTVLYREVILRC